MFVDGSHFVHSPFLGYLWCKERLYIKAPAGRKRHNVLGAFNAISNELITVKNDSYVNSLTVIELIYDVSSHYKDIKITLVMDNAKYQRCAIVMEFAEYCGVELLFLPPYSPNLNLIERLWKFVKKNALNSRYYEDFNSFKMGINDCLEKISTIFMDEVKSLMTLNFHIVKNVVF